MYQKIEQEFKNKSQLRKYQTSVAVFAVLLCIIIVCAIIECSMDIRNLSYWLFCLGISCIAILLPYIGIYIRGQNEGYLSKGEFFKIKHNIKLHKQYLNSQDILLLKQILQQNNINTRAEVQEVIRHYQCLLPRKVITSGTLLSILAFVVSALAFICSDGMQQLNNFASILFATLFIVIICYTEITMVYKDLFSVFSENTMYKRIESALSEIYVTMPVAKRKSKKEKENG